MRGLASLRSQVMQEVENQTEELPVGETLLHGQYQIVRFLGRGGFGISYLARDSLDRDVVIKECFPSALCYRIDRTVQARAQSHNEQYQSVLRQFVREARRLAKLDHPSIVGVHQVFEENNSAYMALDYIDGDDFLSILEDNPQRLTPKVVCGALMDALKAISYTHGLSILHRDISPDNFLLGADNKLTLIDFGAARECAGKENPALSAMIAVKDGYSPHEFYLNEVAQSPSSDLYSLAATFYHLITGATPPDSQERLAAVAAEAPDPYQPLVGSNTDYDPSFLASIDQALSVLPEGRIQSAEEWIEALKHGMEQPALKLEPNWSIDLHSTISQLVQDVNSTIDPNQPKNPVDRKGNPIKSPEPAPEPKPQPVDIFGQPIEDVNAWLKKNDRGGRQTDQPERKKKPKKTKPKADEVVSEDTEDTQPSRSLLSRFFSRQAPPQQIKTSLA